MGQESKSGFWKRQFSEEITVDQDIFDVVFGIIAPILCLVFDPFVFRSGIFGGAGYLHSIQTFAYISVGLGIISLIIWLYPSEKTALLAGIISGIFFVGALLAFALGLVLLPYSIFGLIIVIGVFGLTPFLTAFVYLRNGLRAFRKIQSTQNKNLLVGTMALGVICVIGIPLAINLKTSDLVSQSVHIIIHSNKQEEIDSAINKLQSAFWCSDSCYDQIVWSYSEEDDETKRKILSSAYLKLTGRSIEDRLRQLND